MKRGILVVALGLAAVVLVWAQRDRTPVYPPYEVKSIFPHETSPGLFKQVDEREIQLLAEQGWELVSVMPYIYRNEERTNAPTNPKPMVTQTYPAYFFKRPLVYENRK
jgi:hypothetical protein